MPIVCLCYRQLSSMTLFPFLPMVPAGIKVELIDKMGMYCSDTTMIFLEDVRVPATNIIGKEGMGFVYQMLQFQEERLFAVASSKYGLLFI